MQFVGRNYMQINQTTVGGDVTTIVVDVVNSSYNNWSRMQLGMHRNCNYAWQTCRSQQLDSITTKCSYHDKAQLRLVIRARW